METPRRQLFKWSTPISIFNAVGIEVGMAWGSVNKSVGGATIDKLKIDANIGAIIGAKNRGKKMFKSAYFCETRTCAFSRFLRCWDSQLKACCKTSKFLRGSYEQQTNQINFKINSDDPGIYEFLTGVTFERISLDSNKCKIAIFCCLFSPLT